MGAHHWSLSVAGDDHQTVGEAVASWLRRKGFEEVPADELSFEIDREIERGFFLGWDDRWTVVLYSELAEMERLELELAGLGRPVLGLWLHDSDIWGYELVEAGRIVSAFHSNPRYFGPEEPPRGPDDPAALATLTGVDAATIRSLRSRRALFKERVCEAFAARLGMGPAASQYAYRFEGEKPPGDEGFRWAHRRFRLRDRGRLEGFDLHSIRASSSPAAPPRAAGFDSAALSRAVPPGQRLALRAMMLFAHLLFFLLRPVTWLAGGAFRLHAWLGARRSAATGDGRMPSPSSRYEGGFLVDPSRRFRIRVDEAALLRTPVLVPRGLAFRAGHLEVYGSGVHGPVARGAITHGAGALLYEEDFEIVDRPAKAVGWRREDEKGIVTETHSVYVQTPWLVYQFTGRAHGPSTPEDLATMRSVILTFEVVAAGA